MMSRGGFGRGKRQNCGQGQNWAGASLHWVRAELGWGEFALGKVGTGLGRRRDWAGLDTPYGYFAPILPTFLAISGRAWVILDSFRFNF